MSGARSIVALLLLSAALAGCTSAKTLDNDATDLSSESPPSTTDGAPAPSTDPPALSDDELRDFGIEPEPEDEEVCVPPASVVKDRGKEVDLNKTFAGGAHVHDYWMGRTEATIWDADIRVGDNAAGVSAPFATAVQWIHPQGAYVYPGAGKALFTVTWQDAVPTVPETRRLLWDMPGDEYGTGDLLSHAFLKSGDTFELALNLTNADPVHLNRTTWIFQLQNPETGYWANGHVTWTIHRGDGCLPVDPPHYDLWGGSQHLVLLDDERAGTWRRAFVQSGGLQLPSLLANVTTFGASMVRVTLSWTDAPTNTKLSLRYCTPESPCGSVGATWTTPTTFTEVSAAKRVYEIPIEPIQWDSPYYSKTDWAFQPYMDNGAMSPALGDNGNFEGTARWLIEILQK